MSSPLVSVIIPVYNTEAYIAECLDSVLAQSYTHIEVLCIDDGSTDRSGAIIKEYQMRHSNIRYIAKEQGGQSAARNLGLERAQGEYIAFVDADDFISSTFITELVARTDYRVFAYNFNVLFVNEHGSIRHNEKYAFSGEREIAQDVIDRLDFFVFNGLFSTKVIRAYNIRFLEGYISEDADFVFCYLAFMDRVCGFEGGAYHYRQRADSTTGKLAQKCEVSFDRIYVFRHIVAWLTQHGALHRGLPFQLLTNLVASHSNNAERFMSEAKSMLDELDLPSSMYSHKLVKALYASKNLKELLLHKAMLMQKNPFKRYFKIRIQKGVCICVLFGKILINYTREGV